MVNDYQHALVFVTRWLARLHDGEASPAECIDVLRNYPGPWCAGRAGIPEDLVVGDSHHFVVKEGVAPKDGHQPDDLSWSDLDPIGAALDSSLGAPLNTPADNAPVIEGSIIDTPDVISEDILRRIKVAYCIKSWGSDHGCRGDCGAHMGDPGMRCPEGADDVIDIIRAEADTAAKVAV